MVRLKTTFGDIKLELDTENTPLTAENFKRYASKGFYDGTIFHRVIDNFMIQGGGFDKDMMQKETDLAIDNEAEHAQQNLRGTVAMARTADPHSATAQFFINVTDNPFLDFRDKTRDAWGYCVFGRVIEGMDVVDKIKATATTNHSGYADVPVDPIIIEQVLVEEEAIS